MQIIHTPKELREVISTLKNSGQKIGFTPTMGALHAGHLSLVDTAKEHCDKIVASIFVNPAQFAPHEDFDSYPRQNEDDIEKLKSRGVDIVYLPEKRAIYPEGFDIKISVGKIGQILEGVARPHFFDGVALVVTKLLMQVQPDIAVFGEKDFQQLHIIKKLAKGLDIPVEIIGTPIMREKNGVAMSSRNLYLSEDQMQQASNLYKTLKQIRDAINSGTTPDDAIQKGQENLLVKGFDEISYIELCDADTLAPISKETTSRRLIAAAYLGGIRLLDNIAP